MERSEIGGANDETQDTKKCKGVKKSTVKSDLTHQMYKDCVTKSKDQSVDFVTLQSKDHHIYTTQIHKIALSNSDDKRWVLDDGVHTLAHGHYRLGGASSRRVEQ